MLGPGDLWYKDAVVYALNVETFQDSNGDGIGDFVGLTSRVDYLHALGVSAPALVHDLDLSRATGLCARRFNPAFYPTA